MEQAQNPDEFLENTKLEMYNDQVFCFTPKGDLIGLPYGSTPVDFAYAVHSSVGDKCVGAKINGEIKPLRSVLQNGDQVEVLTSKAQHPSTEWERFVVTGKAKAAIRRYVRACKREQFCLWEKIFWRNCLSRKIWSLMKRLYMLRCRILKAKAWKIYMPRLEKGWLPAGMFCEPSIRHISSPR